MIERVNVLGTEFDVVVEPLGDKTAGESIVHERRIRVDAGMMRSVQVETFYHELMHVMLRHTGLDALLSEQEEEAFAQGLGVALAFVVSANVLPKLEVEERSKHD